MVDDERPTKEQMAEHAKQLSDDIGKMVQQGGGVARAKASEMKEMARQRLEEARHQVRQTGNQLNEKVQRNPWAAVGIAAAIGFLMGLMMTRKRRRHYYDYDE